jgi:hypothetical protein
MVSTFSTASEGVLDGGDPLGPLRRRIPETCTGSFQKTSNSSELLTHGNLTEESPICPNYGTDAAGIISNPIGIGFIEAQKGPLLEVHEGLAAFNDARTSKWEI